MDLYKTLRSTTASNLTYMHGHSDGQGRRVRKPGQMGLDDTYSVGI